MFIETFHLRRKERLAGPLPCTGDIIGTRRFLKRAFGRQREEKVELPIPSRVDVMRVERASAIRKTGAVS
jgi:hypothetical protein